MYSVLTYFTASKTIDFLLHGVEASVGVLIISPKNEVIKRSIIKELRRGVTTFRAQGGYSEADQDVLFTVITRMEITKLEGLVKGRRRVGVYREPPDPRYVWRRCEEAEFSLATMVRQ